MSKLQNIEELIRMVADRILSNHEKLDYVTDEKIKQRLFVKNPECFISIKRLGRDTSPYLLPLCNRAFVVDHRVIQMSRKLIQKLLDDNKGLYNINDLQTILSRLTRMKDTYDKTIPKPPQQASRKALVTKMFKNIKGHLQGISQK